jgi:type I restriction enzyme R subunit
MALHKRNRVRRTTSATIWPQHGWLYAEGDAKGYDTPRAIFPADVLAWVQATQPQAWEALTKSHGAAAEATLLDRVRKQLDDRGTLEVLRTGSNCWACGSP